MRFELEKSDNALHFEWTGSINANQNLKYSLTDYSPFSKGTFYRLKTIKQNNDITYSKTISLNNNISLFEIANGYPNPSSDYISIDVIAKINTKMNIDMLNGTGNVMLHQTANILSGKNVIRLNVKQIPSGIYFFKITDEYNQTLKIIKCNKI